MLDYRVEARPDETSGLYYIEVFHPREAIAPVATTKPVYSSPEEAKRRIEAAIGDAFPNPASRIFTILDKQ